MSTAVLVKRKLVRISPVAARFISEEEFLMEQSSICGFDVMNLFVEFNK